MNREPVASSNISSVGYDKASQTLEVEFQSGQIYQYFDVPENVYEAILGSGSPGTTLNELVKGKYRYARA